MPPEEKCLLKILVISVGSYVKLRLVGHLTEEKRLHFFFPTINSVQPFSTNIGKS